MLYQSGCCHNQHAKSKSLVPHLGAENDSISIGMNGMPLVVRGPGAVAEWSYNGEALKKTYKTRVRWGGANMSRCCLKLKN